MTVKLYECAKVRLRDGTICENIVPYWGNFYKWSGKRVTDGHLLTWTDDGSYSIANKEHDYDVVEVFQNANDYIVSNVLKIVYDNTTDREFTVCWVSDNLNTIGFNTITGRHEIEAFFRIDFEQEQVDAWETVQNIIDDVHNLYVVDNKAALDKLKLNSEYPLFVPGNLQLYDPALTEKITVDARKTLKEALRANENEFARNVAKAVTSKKPALVGEVSPETVMQNLKFGDYVNVTITNGTVTAVEKAEPPKVIADDKATPINRITRDDVDNFRAEQHMNIVAFDAINLLDRYQEIATKSAIYPGKGTPFGLMYAALGLGEAGEVQNKVKKAFRDDGAIVFRPSDDVTTQRVMYNVITPERRAAIIKELGGVLWYIAAVCDELGTTMSEVALTNLDELCGRGERDTLRGDGDDR